MYLSLRVLLCYRSPAAPKAGKPAVLTMPEIKKEVEDMEYDEIKTELSSGVNEDVPPEAEEDEETVKKELDLDSIDMMQLPIQLDDGIDILDDVKYVLFPFDVLIYW